MLASGQDGDLELALYGANLYWTGHGAAAVTKLPLGSGAPTAIAANPYGWASHEVVVDATRVYWRSHNTNNSGKINAVPIGGGETTVLFSGNPTWAIALDSTSVYWVEGYTPAQIMKVPLAGGTPTVVVAADVTSNLAVDASSIYWKQRGAAGSFDLAMASLSGGASTVLAPGAGWGPIAVDGTNVYSAGDGALTKIPKGGGPTTTLASGLRASGPASLALDENSVYWTGRSGDTVMKVPLTGGEVTTLASGENYPNSIAVDATSVYWTVGVVVGTHAVMKVDKTARVEGCADGRYVIMAPGNDACDPNALVKDLSTDLVWTRATTGTGSQTMAGEECAGRGMRLPTKDEALGIAGGKNYYTCAFPCGWASWTSTAASATHGWRVLDYGVQMSVGAGGGDSTGHLCVQ